MIIRTLDLTRVYQRGSRSVVAVDKVSIKVQNGAFVSIVGPSGSGKTTLLNLIGLNDYPTSGKLFFTGKDASALSDSVRRKIRLQNIGFIFQSFNLLPSLTALENIQLPMTLAGVPNKTQTERGVWLLERVGLRSRLQHRPNELSMGERQRVAIARALANDPVVVLADEPTGELDSETGSQIVDLLAELCRKRRRTVVVATHDRKIVESADTTYRIRDGMIRTGDIRKSV